MRRRRFNGQRSDSHSAVFIAGPLLPTRFYRVNVRSCKKASLTPSLTGPINSSVFLFPSEFRDFSLSFEKCADVCQHLLEHVSYCSMFREYLLIFGIVMEF